MLLIGIRSYRAGQGRLPIKTREITDQDKGTEENKDRRNRFLFFGSNIMPLRGIFFERVSSGICRCIVLNDNLLYIRIAFGNVL